VLYKTYAMRTYIAYSNKLVGFLLPVFALPTKTDNAEDDSYGSRLLGDRWGGRLLRGIMKFALYMYSHLNCSLAS
jgi:hypothetical protein